MATRPLDNRSVAAIAHAVPIPFLIAVRPLDSGSILAVAFAISPPLFAAVHPFDSGAVLAVEFAVPPPLSVPPVRRFKNFLVQESGGHKAMFWDWC